MHEDDERVAALDPGPPQDPSGVAGLTATDAAWPFPSDASVALARSVAPPGSCRYLHLQLGQAECLALAPAIAVSDRQVELMCLGPAHVHCPRFVHGGSGEKPRPAPTLRPSAVAVLPATRPAPITGAATKPTNAAPITDAAARPTDADPIAPPDAPPAAAVLAMAATDETGQTAVKADDDVSRDRGRPDAASDTEGLEALAVASRGDGEVAVAPAGSTTPAQVEAVEGPTTPLVTVPARTRLRPEGIRVSQAHERSIALRRSTIAATLVLAAAIVIALAFVAARGGLILPDAGSPRSSQVAVGSQALASPSAGAPAASSAPTTASPALSASASAAPPSTAPPTATHAPTASATPPGGSPGPTFSPAQLAVLKACPGKADCWQYRIHSGDNLHGIAKFFGLTYAALLKANPQITNPSIIHVGEVLTIPLPTT
ncbi:MAG: LysM peptidoglycan-binding domain-containing protein [Candidatus Limnocylindrales bacterium]